MPRRHSLAIPWPEIGYHLIRDTIMKTTLPTPFRLKIELKPLALAACAVLGLSVPASAQWTETSFTAPDFQANERLGEQTLSISGNIGLAAASRYNSNTGRAYLFDVTTGTQLHKLDNPTPAANDYFGLQVSTDGTHALVGARGANEAYLFSVSTGALLATLPNPDPTPNSGFGSANAISGNLAVVGAEWVGKIYVYDVSTPAAPVLLGAAPISVLNSNGIRGDSKTLDLSGTTLIVGGQGFNSFRGAAWLYDLSGLTAGAGTATPVQLTNSYTDTNQIFFGATVDIEGDCAIVGAPGGRITEGDAGTDLAGMAFLYDVSDPAAPVELGQIVPDSADRFSNQRFGSYVGISGNTAVVGANTRFATNPQYGLPGEAYLFDVSTPATPTQLQKLTTGVNLSVDRFGWQVGISGNVALVAAMEDDEVGSNAGKVYIYTGGPLAPLAPFVITGFTYDAMANSATITWNSRNNQSYAVDRSTNLTEGSWEERDDSVASEGELTSYTDQDVPPGATEIYYRIRRP